MRPVSSSIRFNVFFEPRGLRIALERPDVDESKYDRAKAFKKEDKFSGDEHRIVMGGELVRLVCIAGTYVGGPPLVVSQQMTDYQNSDGVSEKKMKTSNFVSDPISSSNT